MSPVEFEIAVISLERLSVSMRSKFTFVDSYCSLRVLNSSARSHLRFNMKFDFLIHLRAFLSSGLLSFSPRAILFNNKTYSLFIQIIGETEALMTLSSGFHRVYGLDQWIIYLRREGGNFPPWTGRCLYYHITYVDTVRIRFENLLSVKENAY